MVMPVHEKWLAYLAQRGRSDDTLRTYRSSMRRFLTYVNDDPITATVDQAQQWWDDLDELAPRTRARTLSSVRSFYTWAMRYDLIERDPTRRLDAPSLHKGTHRYVDRAELDILLEKLPPDLRRAVVLGAWAGLRISEVAALRWSDIDRDRMRIHVEGKGDKRRDVGMHPLLLDALVPEPTLRTANIITGTTDTYSAGALQRRVNRAIQAAGVDATFHKLRHRFGTITYGITGDPIAVAAAMGHSSLETTRIYAAVSDEALDRVAAAAVR